MAKYKDVFSQFFLIPTLLALTINADLFVCKGIPGKLLVHPIFAWIVLSGIFGFILSDVKTSMMAAAAPCGTMAFMLALNYQVRTDAIAPAILLSTLVMQYID